MHWFLLYSIWGFFIDDRPTLIDKLSKRVFWKFYRSHVGHGFARAVREFHQAHAGLIAAKRQRWEYNERPLLTWRYKHPVINITTSTLAQSYQHSETKRPRNSRKRTWAQSIGFFRHGKLDDGVDAKSFAETLTKWRVLSNRLSTKLYFEAGAYEVEESFTPPVDEPPPSKSTKTMIMTKRTKKWRSIDAMLFNKRSPASANHFWLKKCCWTALK